MQVLCLNGILLTLTYYEGTVDVKHSLLWEECLVERASVLQRTSVSCWQWNGAWGYTAKLGGMFPPYLERRFNLSGMY